MPTSPKPLADDPHLQVSFLDVLLSNLLRPGGPNIQFKDLGIPENQVSLEPLSRLLRGQAEPPSLALLLTNGQRLIATGASLDEAKVNLKAQAGVVSSALLAELTSEHPDD